MSVSKSEIVKCIEEKYPLGLQEEYDNSGWQINLAGEPDEVSRVLVALEITGDVIDEARGAGVDFVVEHHPLFFGEVKNVDVSLPDPRGAYVVSLVRAGISVYAAHTNFDCAADGMNDALARAFGLSGVSGFPCSFAGAGAGAPAPAVNGGSAGSGSAFAMGRMGVLSGAPVPFGEICTLAEDVFDMRGRLKTVGDPRRLVSSIAICGGAGGDYVPDAVECGVDLYITSDVKHHQAQWAREKGLCLIDGGHYGTEKIFVPVMASFLRGIFSARGVEVTESLVSADPFRCADSARASIGI
jgi:dinuclear metal center YbgI/SA1388 family protein